jgi:hypothetical protein
MVCRLNSGDVVIINSLDDLRDYIDEDLFKFIEETDVYNLKECIDVVQQCLEEMQININNSKRFSKSKVIKEINNILKEIKILY